MLRLTRIVLIATSTVCLIMIIVGSACTAGATACDALLGELHHVVGAPLIILGSVGFGAPLIGIGGAALIGTAAALFRVDGGSNRAVAAASGARAEEATPLLASVGAGSGSASSRATARRDREIRAFMYASHFLSAWGDRMWQFAIPLLFMDIFLYTLLPSALFSLLLYSGVVFSMSSAGRWVDSADRMAVVGRAIVIDNVCIVLSSLLLALLIWVAHSENAAAAAAAAARGEPAPPLAAPAWDARVVAIFIGINALGVLAEVMNQVQTLALERDWVVVLAHGMEEEGGGGNGLKESGGLLGQMNRTMRRIDLLCKILAPITYGVLMQFSGGAVWTRAIVGAVMVGAWNLISFPIEYVLAKDVYEQHPGLRVKPRRGSFALAQDAPPVPPTTVSATPPRVPGISPRKHPSFGTLDPADADANADADADDVDRDDGGTKQQIATASGMAPAVGSLQRRSESGSASGRGQDQRHGHGQGQGPTSSKPRPADTTSLLHALRQFARSWRLYLQHHVFLASFAYALLYMTVLDNGALMTAYLEWRGVPQATIGLNRGFGACFGVAGTFLFPYIQTRTGSLLRAGVISIWLFFFTLLPCMVTFIVVGESTTSDYTLIGCMIVSRAGLWAFDLAETQIMQEWTEPARRGLLNGMQTATYQLAFVVMQAMGMVFHDPRQFGVLVVLSIAAVGVAAWIYTVWSRQAGTRQRETELYAVSTS